MLRAKRLLFFVSVVGFELSLLSHWSMFSNATSVVPQVSRRYMADSYDPIEPTRLGDYKRRLRFVRRSSEIPESPQDSREPVFSSGPRLLGLKSTSNGYQDTALGQTDKLVGDFKSELNHASSCTV
ncbi:hypothetical protein RRG08_019289 [Elysia crispata]|uniref:Uncharacterized protein n=1 Tax=Elysia crispata TaxID=231223 RepID=A0AAE0YMC5_9GAST|nr:hypothetical protein RRG08_019289 [Elysia crispata]